MTLGSLDSMFLEFLLPKPFVLMVTSCSEMFIICHSEDVLINVVHVSVLDMGAWPLGPMGSELVLRDDSLEGRRVRFGGVFGSFIGVCWRAPRVRSAVGWRSLCGLIPQSRKHFSRLDCSHWLIQPLRNEAKTGGLTSVCVVKLFQQHRNRLGLHLERIPGSLKVFPINDLDLHQQEFQTNWVH